MPTDPKDTVLPLSHASILVELAAEVRRFRVYTAVLLPRRGRRVRVRFDGPQGTVTLELPLVTLWQLTAVFHDRSVRRGRVKERASRVPGLACSRGRGSSELEV